MALQYQDLLREISELKRMVGSMVRKGSVHQQDGESLRFNLGPDENGKDTLTGWIRMSQPHGNGRYSRWFGEPKEGGQGGQGGAQSGSGSGGYQGGGQNVLLFCPGGDLTQAVPMPYGPNENYQRPENATKDGKDGEFYQQKSHFRSYTPDTWEHWHEEEEGGGQGGQGGSGGGSSGGSGGQGGQGQQKERKTGQGGKAKFKQRGSKDGGLTGRIGDKVRYAAHEKGAKVWTKNSWHAAVGESEGNHTYNQAKGNVYVRAGKEPIVNKPWVIMNSPDEPIPNDNNAWLLWTFVWFTLKAMIIAGGFSWLTSTTSSLIT